MTNQKRVLNILTNQKRALKIVTNQKRVFNIVTNHRIQSAYRDAAASGGEAAQMLQARMEESMQKYLSYKAALLEPSTMNTMTSLMAATGSWLVKLTTGDVNTLPDSQLPMGDHTSPLSFIPEFVLENICEHLLMVRRFNPSHFEQVSRSSNFSILHSYFLVPRLAPSLAIF